MRRQEEDTGLEKVVGKCKAGSGTNLKMLKFRTGLLILKQLLRVMP